MQTRSMNVISPAQCEATMIECASLDPMADGIEPVANAPFCGDATSKRISTRAASRPCRLLPQPLFVEQVRLEQIRSTRSLSAMCLISIKYEGHQQDAHHGLLKLARAFNSRLRESDILGWHGRDAIAVLLVDTAKVGGENCVKKIQDEAKDIPVSISMQTYPEGQFALDDEPKLPSNVAPLYIEDIARFSWAELATKRLIDVLGSVAGLVLLFPFMLLIAIAIKTTSQGPIIFKQIRLGKRGVPFEFYKFRTMRSDVDDQIHRAYVESLITQDLPASQNGTASSPVYKILDDPRITPVGKFLRSTSLDEIPQLVNVLRGEMSLVGPRPPIPYEVENYQTWHLRRIQEVKPGITGLWQVEGRSLLSFSDMVRLDLDYSRHWSLLLDLKILLKTVKAVILRQGAD